LEGPQKIAKPAEQGAEQAHTPTTDGSAAKQPTDDAAAADEGERAVACLIAAARKAFPLRSIKWLAKKVGQPEEDVRRYLEGGDAA
jgi:hypothetical protein